VEWEFSCCICVVVGWIQWRTYVIVIVSLEGPCCAVGLYLTIQRLLASHGGHFGLVTSYQTIWCRNPEDVRLKKNTGTSTVVSHLNNCWSHTLHQFGSRSSFSDRIWFS
jgi:hypothetical protein